MAAGQTPSFGRVAPEDLIALTEEMAALVRAGVPLEQGLTQVARDLARRPGTIAAELARRMQAGESLTHILASSPETFPPSYCAVVEAGMRSGRLPAALEGLASASRQLAEMRRMTRLAMLYPVFVALLAYGLFIGSLIWLQPRITHTYEVMEAPPSAINLALADLGRSAPDWATPLGSIPRQRRPSSI
jgi:general secretion pathway protein F